MLIPEDFLHYLWKFRLFSQKDLKTASGESLNIISVGIHNKNAGPDFENAHIRIGNTLWAGNVEIHLRSSDWERHQHQFDKAYDNVILHVVGKHDLKIFRTDGTEIPVFVLDELIPPKIVANYFNLMEAMSWIPCEKQIKDVDPFYINSWLSRILTERLEEKLNLIEEILVEVRGSWDDAFYIILARNFGFKTNSVPFEILARSLPQQLLARYKNKPLQIEALIFGQAGFLNGNFKDDYPKMLKREYLFLKEKHSLSPIDKYLWKYMRLRPRNFPTIRLAQFAALAIKSNHLFSRILDEKDLNVIIQMFRDLPVNCYWDTHYRFELKCSPSSSCLGEQSVNNILVNTISTFLFAFGKRTSTNIYIDRCLNLLEKLPPETNGIIRRFNELGVKPESAYFSQSLMQLKKTYCDQKKCLSCGIGTKLLNL